MPNDKQLRNSPQSSMFAVLMCIVLGAFPIGISLGIIPVEPSKIHAPIWLIALMGLLFWLAAISMLAPGKPNINNFLGAVMFALFAVIGGWVAVKGEPNHFGGGIPFLSHSANEAFARWLFGGGALICVAVAGYAFKKAMARRG